MNSKLNNWPKPVQISDSVLWKYFIPRLLWNDFTVNNVLWNRTAENIQIRFQKSFDLIVQKSSRRDVGLYICKNDSNFILSQI